MTQRNFIRGLAVIVTAVVTIVAALPLWAAPADTPAAAQSTAGNLLVNPGFESPYGKQCCQTDLSTYLPNTPIDEVQVAQGWSGWWRSNSLPDYPARCDIQDAPPNCKAWHRPEWREAAPYANRIRSGLNAQKYFTFWSVHEAGMYQRVSGLKPGQKLQFSAYMSAWSTDSAELLVSSGQQTMNLKVGIDPYGGTDAFSSNVVWGKPGDSYDVFGQFTVEAVAQNSTVTVFTYSMPVYALQHNDVYVDDAALVVVGGGAVMLKPKPASSAGGGSTASTVVAGPYPGTTLDKTTGNILYVVQTGDTTWSVSQKFNVTANQIVTWNNLANANVLRIGKTIIVGKTTR